MKLTAPVKLVRLMAMTELAVEPRVTEVALPGPTVKSPVPVTVSDTEVVRDNVPDVAVKVTVAGPRVAVLDGAERRGHGVARGRGRGIEHHGDAARQAADCRC